MYPISRLKILWFLFLLMLIPCGGIAGPGDAQIHFHRGLAAEDRGDLKSASKLYKKACMAEDGLAEGCLRWAKLSSGPEQSKELKRALGSAVMLDPQNVESRYLLAKLLLEKKDYVWAIEHLLAAQGAATHKSNQGLIGYYLGYAQYKSGDLESAGKNLEQAQNQLPPPLRQRCLYYRALVALEQGIGACPVLSFDAAKLKPVLNIPDNYDIGLMLVLGYPAESPQIEASTGSIETSVDDKGIRHVPKRQLKDILHRNGF